MKPIGRTYSGRFALFFWLGFGIVFLLNLLVWLYLNQTEREFKTQLRDRLRDANQLLARLIHEYNEDVSINLLVPGEQTSLEHLFYRQVFEEIRGRGTLQAILLVSPQGDLLISSPAILSQQTILSFTGSPLFMKALQGESVVSEIEEYGGERFMTGYTPITDLDGFLLGVLIIEAKAGYFDILNTLKNNMLLFSLLNFVLISLIAVILFRLVRRTIRYEREIRDREHLVQLGTMAASVAHELRNPLNIIEATNDTIRKKYAQNQDEMFEYIPQEIKRLNSLIDDFLRFARTPQLHPETIDLVSLIERVKMGFPQDERERINVSFETTDTRIYSDGNLLQQVLTNITANALQASSSEQAVQIVVKRRAKKQLQITVEDHGRGIPEQDLKQIFEPFFTTKEKGTGLGLAISKRLIQVMQGGIEVDSQVNKGTKVTIVLPELQQ